MNEIGTILNTGFGLVLLWVSVYFGWRPYRLDRVRNELFELRNELFILAAERQLPFNGDAYRRLSARINAMIRFAHIVTFTRGVLFGVDKDSIIHARTEAENKALVAAIDELPEEVRDKVKRIHERMHLILVLHMVKGSPFLWFALAVSLPVLALLSLLRLIQESPQLFIRKELRIYQLEEQATLAFRRECIPESNRIPCEVRA